MADDDLRRRVLQDPIVYFKEWAAIGDHPRTDAWRKLQRRIVGDYCHIDDDGEGWRLVKVNHAKA